MADDQKQLTRPARFRPPFRRSRIPADAKQRYRTQHELFGGVHWGAAFFGWLSANGLAVLLVTIVSAAGVALELTRPGSVDRQWAREQMAGTNTETIGLVGGLAVLAVVALAYYAGGYVAGRMSRFDGTRQGFAVWLIGFLVVLAAAVIASVFGNQYDILARLDLPRIPVDEGTATRGAVLALVSVMLVSALAAAVGGKAGERYHRRIDRSPFVD